MNSFSGFPPGKQRLVQVPSLFFSDLLPCIDHLIEMKVTLYCLWAVQRQEGKFRYVRFAEVLNDDLFLQGIPVPDPQKMDAVQDGFDRSVTRGTLLRVRVRLASGEEDIYFLNTAKGREAVKAIEKGHWIPGDDQRPIQLIIERPNLYVIYEQNIGALTPMIAEQLRDLERDYAASWIEDAIRIATSREARNLSFIVSILKRWEKEGRQPPFTAKAGSKDTLESIKARYADLIED